MATLALAAAGAAVGSAVPPTGITVLGATITGATIGSQIGAIAGSVIDQALLGGGRQVEGPRLSELHLTASTEGAAIPRIYGRSYALEGEIHVPEDGAEGVIIAFADFIGGFALWIDDQGMLNHTYQYLGIDTYKQTSTTPVPKGDVTVKMLFEIDGPTPGSGGTVTLWANDEQIGEGRLEKTISLIFTTYAGMDVGRDNGGVVDLAYEDRAPYAFTGTIKNVGVDLDPAGAATAHSHEDKQALHAHNTHVAVAAGIHG